MAVERVYGGTSIVDVLDRILDKGLVIDAWVRVSLVGIELLTIEARVVVASVDTYLRYAQAIGLTPLSSRPPREQGQGALGAGGNGQGASGLLGQGGLGGLVQNVVGQLPGGQSQSAQAGDSQSQGNAQGAGGTQGLAGQLQGLLDQLQSAGGEGAGAQGAADQLRSLLDQLQQGQGQSAAQGARA